MLSQSLFFFFFFQAEDGIRDHCVTGVQTCALPISPGVPCTATASGTAWRQVFDDSLGGSAPWNLASTDLKWVRIQLKANNNTPVPVNGDSNSSAQACWNGSTQMSTPTGYTTGCQPVGGVTAATVITSGTSYTSVPTVNFAGGGGTGATATAVLLPESTGYVASISVTTGGSGYTIPPTVTLSGGGGSAATATAVLSSTGTTVTNPGSVVSVSLTTGGASYTTAPTVTLSGGGGVGASAIATLSSSGVITTTGYVSSVTVTAGGSSYTSAPTVNLSGGGGSGATATTTLGTSGNVTTVNVTSPGTQCYSAASDAVVSFTGGGGSGATATAVLEGSRSCIYSVSVTNIPQCTNKLTVANGYSPADQKAGVTFEVAGQNKSFSGTLFVSNANDKTPTSMSVQNPGYDTTGYSAATFTSNLQLSGGAWADCGNITVTATTGYRIASINVTNGGSGYTSVPTASITGGVGSTSNPTATAALGHPVASVNVTNGGSSYTSAPTVSLTGGGGSGAAATASVVTASTTTYPVASVTVTAGGSGYTSAPAVGFSGGGGAGAAGTANIATTTTTTYPVQSVTVTAGGTGYSTPPTVSFSGGGGSGAAATATLSTMPSGTYYVDHIDINNAGSGYTANPTVTITGGGGSGATATSQISGGTKFGKVWLVTSLAQTATGARSMLQMEVASPVLGFALGGALTLDGPNPSVDAMPNSDSFRIKGNDANSCGGVQEADHPAIDGFDDPNANPPTNSVETVKDSLPRPDHYTGSGGTPSVQNGFASLGETMTTPDGLSSVIGAIYNAPGAQHYDASNVGSFNPSSTTKSSITYVDGDLNLGGNNTGNGILVVTGTLTMSGNFSWNGLIFVIGDGNVQFSGGGNGQITGSIIVAKIWDGSHNLLNAIGSPTFHWNGG